MCVQVWLKWSLIFQSPRRSSALLVDMSTRPSVLPQATISLFSRPCSSHLKSSLVTSLFIIGVTSSQQVGSSPSSSSYMGTRSFRYKRTESLTVRDQLYQRLCGQVVRRIRILARPRQSDTHHRAHCLHLHHHAWRQSTP